MMRCKVNGQEVEIPDTTTVRQLAARYHFVPEKVAIELNRRLVRPAGYDAPLNEGDQIEIVTFVGGGA